MRSTYDIWESRICLVGLAAMAAGLVWNYMWAMARYGN